MQTFFESLNYIEWVGAAIIQWTMNMLYLKTEPDGAEDAPCNSKTKRAVNLPAFCLVTVCWNKSQETETMLVR